MKLNQLVHNNTNNHEGWKSAVKLFESIYASSTVTPLIGDQSSYTVTNIIIIVIIIIITECYLLNFVEKMFKPGNEKHE